MIIKLKNYKYYFQGLCGLIVLAAAWSFTMGQLSLGIWQLVSATFIFLYVDINGAFIELAKEMFGFKQRLELETYNVKRANDLIHTFTNAPMNDKGIVLIETDTNLIKLEVTKLSQSDKAPAAIAVGLWIKRFFSSM